MEVVAACCNVINAVSVQSKLFSGARLANKNMQTSLSLKFLWIPFWWSLPIAQNACTTAQYHITFLHHSFISFTWYSFVLLFGVHNNSITLAMHLSFPSNLKKFCYFFLFFMHNTSTNDADSTWFNQQITKTIPSLPKKTSTMFSIAMEQTKIS